MTDRGFDTLAGEYDAYRTGYSSGLIDAVVGFGAQPGRELLDVGCGTGIATAAFCDRDCVMTGIDPSEPMLERARDRVPRATFVQGRVESLPFANNTFDGSICAHAFHWFDAVRAFEELIRVTRPGGPVATWWKVLSTDEPLRAIRETASEELGVGSLGDLLAGGFNAFYAAPFGSRALRVLPFVTTVSVEGWVGYERSRRRALEAYGEARDRYLQRIEQLLLERYRVPTATFEVRYVQFLYVGFVPAT